MASSYHAACPPFASLPIVLMSPPQTRLQLSKMCLPFIPRRQREAPQSLSHFILGLPSSSPLPTPTTPPHPSPHTTIFPGSLYCPRFDEAWLSQKLCDDIVEEAPWGCRTGGQCGGEGMEAHFLESERGMKNGQKKRSVSNLERIQTKKKSHQCAGIYEG